MEIDFIIDAHNITIHTILIMDWKLVHHSLDNNGNKNLNIDFKDAFPNENIWILIWFSLILYDVTDDKQVFASPY